MDNNIPNFDNEFTNENQLTQGGGSWLTGWSNSLSEMFKITFANWKAITLTWITKSQVGLGDVDNTSDADKPVSTAQQTAINDSIVDVVDDLVSINTDKALSAN